MGLITHLENHNVAFWGMETEASGLDTLPKDDPTQYRAKVLVSQELCSRACVTDPMRGGLTLGFADTRVERKGAFPFIRNLAECRRPCGSNFTTGCGSA